MAERQQRSNKEAKKQKKDAGAPKGAASSDRPVAPVTAVMLKGKEAKKAR